MAQTNPDRHMHNACITHTYTPNRNCTNYSSLTASRLDKKATLSRAFVCNLLQTVNADFLKTALTWEAFKTPNIFQNTALHLWSLRYHVLPYPLTCANLGHDTYREE